MFYAIEILLKNDKTNEFALVWRLAHQTTLTRKYKKKIKNVNVENICTNIVKQTNQFDLRTMSYLLMGTTTLYQMQVDEFDKFVQSILHKFKFVDGAIGIDKNLMQHDGSKKSTTKNTNTNVANLMQFEDGVDFDELDIVHLKSDFVSINQLRSNQSRERNLQMPLGNENGINTQTSMINGATMDRNNNANYGDDSDFDNMPFNISMIQQPASQSENENGYISVAGYDDDFNNGYDDDNDFGNHVNQKNNNDMANHFVADESVDLMPPPPPKRLKMSTFKVDESIQLPIGRTRDLINDRSSLLRPDTIMPLTPFTFRKRGITSLRFMLDMPSVPTSNQQVIDAFRLSNNSHEQSAIFNKHILNDSNDGYVNDPEFARGGNDNNDADNFGDDEMGMDIDHDEGFIEEEGDRNQIVDLDDNDNTNMMIVDDDGFDMAATEKRQDGNYNDESLVDDALFKRNLRRNNRKISPEKLLSMIIKHQKKDEQVNSRAEEKNESGEVQDPDKPLIFKELLKVELQAFDVADKKRLAAKCFHDLLKLKMTNKIDFYQSNAYGPICVTTV